MHLINHKLFQVTYRCRQAYNLSRRMLLMRVLFWEKKKTSSNYFVIMHFWKIKKTIMNNHVVVCILNYDISNVLSNIWLNVYLLTVWDWQEVVVFTMLELTSLPNNMFTCSLNCSSLKLVCIETLNFPFHAFKSKLFLTNKNYTSYARKFTLDSWSTQCHCVWNLK